MSRETEQLRAQATAAREELVSTVGEFGETLQEAKRETVQTAKQYAPYAAGVAGFALVLRVLTRLR